MAIDYSDKTDFTENETERFEQAQSLANLLVECAKYRHSDEGVYSAIIDKGGNTECVIINHILDALWAAEDEKMDLIKILHSAVLRVSGSLGSDEAHNKMRELLRLLDAKYGDFP